MAEDQKETIAFLSRGASYGLEALTVERIETHCSIVFLVGNRAYKLKRCIAFSVLDYLTVERREAACKAEVTLNRRTAPELYLAASAIRRGANGLTFEGNGPIVDWVVVMRRFDQADLFDHLADARRLNATIIRQLAQEVATFHQTAAITRDFGGADGIRSTIERWQREWAEVAAQVDGAGGQAYHTDAALALAETAELLERRRREGKVRRCHGDLRLANICLLDRRPTLFDCIEFSDEISCIDVLYDLAFPLMELHHRGLAECGNILFNHYADLTGESEGLRVLPLFLSIRAAMRAEMLAAAAQRHALSEHQHFRSLAHSHLALAQSLLRRRPPRLIAIGGLSGSGKAAVAYGLAANFAPAPGARVIRSDTVRKRLMSVSPDARLPATAYDAGVNRRAYEALRGEAAAVLAAGTSVIVDATFLHPEDRASMAEVARAAHVPFTGLWLEMSRRELEARAEHRSGDPATRDYAVLCQQLATDQGRVDWHVIDAGRGPDTSLAAARLITETFHC
jgi:uncharacterized protein